MGEEGGGNDVEVLLYVHRNRRLIRDGSPGRPPLGGGDSSVVRAPDS